MAKFGRDVTLRSHTETGTAWDPTLATVDTVVKAVVINYMPHEIDGTLILATDKKAIFASTFAPTVAMKLIDGEETLEIVNVSIIKPGATVCLYEVQAR